MCDVKVSFYNISRKSVTHYCLSLLMHDVILLIDATSYDKFRKNVKRQVCEDKNSPLEHDIPLLVNGKMIMPFCKRIIFSEYLQK